MVSEEVHDKNLSRGVISNLYVAHMLIDWVIAHFRNTCNRTGGELVREGKRLFGRRHGGLYCLRLLSDMSR